MLPRAKKLRNELLIIYKRGCQWDMALVSKQLKKSHLVSKLSEKLALVSKQQQRSLVR